MRRSNKDGYISHYGDGRKLQDFFRWLKSFLKSCIGKSFDEAYSKVCRKYPNNIGDVSPRERFKEWIRWDYIIDDEGIIREGVRHKRPKKAVKIPIRKIGETYKFYRWRLLYSYAFYKVFGYRQGSEIQRTGKLSRDQYMRAIHSHYWDMLSDCIEVEEQYEYIVYPKGTKEYFKLRGESKDTQSKKERDEKKFKESELNATFRSKLSKDKKNRKIKMEEMRALKKKEELDNQITRDRLGFNEESFMGPNYNSRKNRKLKNILNDKPN